MFENTAYNSNCPMLIIRFFFICGNSRESRPSFQLFYAFQIIGFVKPSKISFCFPFNFSVRLKTPTTQASLEVWKQIQVAGGQVIGLENMVDAEAIRNPIRAFLRVQCAGFFSSSNVAVSS